MLLNLPFHKETSKKLRKDQKNCYFKATFNFVWKLEKWKTWITGKGN